MGTLSDCCPNNYVIISHIFHKFCQNILDMLWNKFISPNLYGRFYLAIGHSLLPRFQNIKIYTKASPLLQEK
jgi:hypothetical protein